MLFAGFVVVALFSAYAEFRTFQDRRAARRPKEDKTLRDLAESAAEKSPVLLLLDQFEEFLIVAAPDVQARFVEFVKDLAQRPVKNLHLLLSLRKDYQQV